MRCTIAVAKDYFTQAFKNPIAVIALTIMLICWAYEPIPQDPLYHGFADQRNIFGIAHALGALSNALFCLVGIPGIYLTISRRGQLNNLTNLYLTFFIAVTLTAFGSAFYHFNPTNATLVWDRLPMSVGFMSIFAAIVAQRIHLKLGQTLHPWLVVASITSVFYWQWQDDLPPCLLLQFGTLLALPLILLLYRRPASR